ncbi:MAG: hypothetical protein ACOY42_04085 [Pseudomonadota bacterium]
MEPGRRDRYLAALGIVRYRLRAAAPAAGAAGAEMPAAPCAPPRGSASAPAPGASPQPPAPPLAAQPAGEPGELLQVRLACWQPAPDLLVLDALPVGGRPERERLTLLANILRAIGRLEGPLPAVEYLDWPPWPGGDASASGAREGVALFLAGRRAASPFAWLLAMGEPAWRCLSGDAGAGDQILLDGEVRAILVPGLGDMLADPGLKAVTWKAIRALAPEPR